MSIKYSVIIPIYNESESVPTLHSELLNVMNKINSNFEIIYVNDGSSDSSLATIKALSFATVLDLRRNYGQATALDAGFKYASGDVVISLDGDGQNDPNDIPALIRKLEDNDLDVVAGWRVERHDVGYVRTLTRIGRSLRRFLLNDPVHDSGCTLRVYTKEAVDSLNLYGEMHRYILALLRWQGFRIGEMPVHHRARTAGVSKYGPGKAIRGFIDLLYVWFIHKYSQRPLHLYGLLSLVSFAFGLLCFVLAVYEKVLFDVAINRSGYFLLGGFSLIASILFFSFGVVVDLLLRVHYTTSPYERRYQVRSVVKS